MRMKLLDLFSGIGGFSLAAEWVWGEELEIVGFVEIDKYCQKVLKKHWPNVPIWNDIKTFHYDGEVDLITGGVPCQDISIAGKGAGIEGEKSGLWSEYKRIIGECRPEFALIENVPALTYRGLDRILCDLAEIGYNAEWQCISASEMGSWHKRERIWIVAYPNEINSNARCSELYRKRDDKGIQSGNRSFLESATLGETISDTECEGLERQWKPRENSEIGRDKSRVFTEGSCKDRTRYWQSEPELGRVAHGIPDRVDRLKSLGNAIVPQVAYIIMQQLKQYI